MPGRGHYRVYLMQYASVTPFTRTPKEQALESHSVGGDDVKRMSGYDVRSLMYTNKYGKGN
jgi:hypothetical protein